MLQGQKFQFGNYQLQNLMDAQNKYRMDTAQRTGRPLESVTTPYDEQISKMEEDLNDSAAEYELAQKTPITQSYKNKVKGLQGMAQPEEKLEEDLDSPDLEKTMDDLLSPKPTNMSMEPPITTDPTMSVEPTLGGPTEDTDVTQPLMGEDIQPDDTEYYDKDVYDSDAYPLAQKGDVKKKGHNVLAQIDAKLFPKMAEMGQAPGPNMSVGQPAPMDEIEGVKVDEVAPLNMDFMSKVPEMPYAPPGPDEDADIMLKNMDLLKTPPLKFKPAIYRKPEAEKYEYEPVRPTDRLGTYAKYLMDYSNFLGGKGWTNEMDKFYDKDMARLDRYKADQYKKLQDMNEKNRQSNQDAFTKFQYDQNTKFKMASLDQAAQQKANALKLQMLRLQVQKNKGNKDYKEAYKMGHQFQKLEHVSSYPERVNAFRNAMMAPTTGAGDKDIIENLVKFIDPKGVIREGKVKFMTSALKSVSHNPDGSLNVDKFQRMMHVAFKGGFLTPEDRKELLEATIPMMQNFTQTYQRSYDQHKAVFINRGWDPNLLMPFDLAVATPEQLEAARNKINADYLKGQEDRKQYQGASAKTLGGVPGDVFGGIKDFFGFGDKEPEKGSYLDELEKQYPAVK